VADEPRTVALSEADARTCLKGLEGYMTTLQRGLPHVTGLDKERGERALVKLESARNALLAGLAPPLPVQAQAAPLPRRRALRIE
jgi:hypothetical protein